MKILILFFCLTTIHLVVSKSELCYDKQDACDSTNYQTYVDCIRRRQRRSADCNWDCDSDNCIDTCNECDCSSCNYSRCTNSCSSCCSTCCSNYVPCNTNHCCHKTCHSQCSSSSCRSSCRRNCFESVRERTQDRFIIEQNGGQTAGNSSINNINKHNITTIIHLNNVINNTNLIDIPIVLNNTNTQNITLFNEESGGSSSLVERCCTVISPRQCVSKPTPRCFHYRSKQCGAFCTASIVHKEQQQICSANYPGAQPTCSQQIVYIPQPQPKCTYQSAWPYVSCGVQREEACQGCYSHYVNGESNNYLTCPPQCYDDGFGSLGPLYRQGPVYRPWYSHTPCYQCLGYPSPYDNIGYGGGYPVYPEGYPYGGYQIPYGGYPAPYGGYPAPIGSYYQPGVAPQGGDNNNNSGLISLPIPFASPNQQIGDIEIEPGEIDQSEYNNQLYNGRLPREVEIEVSYEPSSDAQAEVKIQGNVDSNMKIEENFDGENKMA